MNILLDKLIVFVLCLVFYLQNTNNFYLVVPVIFAVGVSALNSYLENDVIKLLGFIAYCAVCLIFPLFLFFLPLISYDIFLAGWQYLILVALLPLGTGFTSLPVGTCLFIVLFMALSWLIKRRTISLEKTKSEYITLRDTTKEFSLLLESKNKELLEKQDYEINLAILKERNRIARDIHDNIGHILSKAILQTGALLATCRDEVLNNMLNILKETLVHGMNSIRESIHDLHDESLDLYAEVTALIDGFHFCEISLDYDLEGNPDKKVKYTILAVIKETLSNIIKHSDATWTKITIKEHPAFYQLIIKDNGSKKEVRGKGIGLNNITQRVHDLKGIINIGSKKGFVIFISLPKE